VSPDDRLAYLLDLLAGSLAVILMVVVYKGQPGLPRILLALAFAFFVPGRALVTNWPAMAGWSQAVMSMVLSFGILILVATVALWAGYWHPVGLFQAEAALSLAGLAVGSGRRYRSESGTRRRRVGGQP
jgi:peptidoglycan/LPS O-acetylase OafA/YrhL